jgi:hypothetical protein
MPHAQVWQQGLTDLFGSSGAGLILSRAQTNYEEYDLLHSAETKRSNREALRTRILPGLALYQAMLAEGMERQQALADLDTLFKAAFFSKRLQGIRILNRLPNPFAVVKPVMKLMMRQEYLPGSQEIVADNSDTFAVNVYRCYIFDTLAAHGAAELTTLYCNTDDWLAAELPSVNWERTKTLGRGGDCCDFRWSRKM